MKSKTAKNTDQSLDHIAEALRPLAIPIQGLSHDPSNARQHNDRNMSAIKSSLAMFGQRTPIVVQKSGMIVRKGNGTMAAAKTLGWTHVAAIVIDDDNSTAVQYAIADNRTAELADWDDETLASLLDSMSKDQKDAIGFNDQDIDELLARLNPEEEEEKKELELDDISDELPGASALKDDMVFESDLPYDLPPLIPEMCASLPEGPIMTWCGPFRSNIEDAKTWLWPWKHTTMVGMPPMHSVIPCFYVDDYKFEGLWTDIEKWTTRLLNAGVKTVMMPNYSLHSEGPLVMQIYNLYRSRWVARYFQEAGLKVIPDVISFPRIHDVALGTLPKNLEVAACELQCDTSSQEFFDSAVADFKEYERQVQPKRWIVYGGPVASRIVDTSGIDPSKVVFVASKNAYIPRAGKTWGPQQPTNKKRTDHGT
jgi:hypothetical protein